VRSAGWANAAKRPIEQSLAFPARPPFYLNMIHQRNIMCQYVRETAGLLVLAAAWADALEVGEAGEVQPLALRARPPAILTVIQLSQM